MRRFQRSRNLSPDGIAGPLTHAALHPWYTGYQTVTVRSGDTYYSLAQANNTTIRAIEIANPGVNPLNLTIGARLTVPLGFDLVPVDIDYSSELVRFCCEGLAARYPILERGTVGNSVMGRPLELLSVGSGSNRVFYNASHHANEWITTPILLRFMEELARAASFEEAFYGMDAVDLLRRTRLSMVPAVNPDGIDLVCGVLKGTARYRAAADIASAFPTIPFPQGWKANIVGTDLNLQYPAGWDMAREIKFAQGYVRPAPRDYVGSAPLTAPESLALYDYTLRFSPNLTISYHTQGETIFWKYLDYEPANSRAIAFLFAEESGYAVSETPYASGYAGYKDWFIQNYNRPGYTIEAGLGENPLPLSQFPKIYADNVGILTLGLTIGSIY